MMMSHFLTSASKTFLPSECFHVHRNRALVAIQHGEVKAVRVGDIAQLTARRIALRVLELDDIRAHPCE
jgi:hypothetical protein